MSESLQPYGLQHTRPPCPLSSLEVHPNTCPLSLWCHPAISSSVIPFSSCPQSFPASGSFPKAYNSIFLFFPPPCVFGRSSGHQSGNLKTKSCCCLVAQSCPTLCDPMDCSMPGLPVHNQLPEFTQTHVHRVNDAIQLSHPLLSPSPPTHNPSQHQSLFQWVNSSHEAAKVLEFQL